MSKQANPTVDEELDWLIRVRAKDGTWVEMHGEKWCREYLNSHSTAAQTELLDEIQAILDKGTWASLSDRVEHLIRTHRTKLTGEDKK